MIATHLTEQEVRRQTANCKKQHDGDDLAPELPQSQHCTQRTHANSTTGAEGQLCTVTSTPRPHTRNRRA